jgi:hypothetical protein
MKLLAVIAAVISRGFASCELTPITVNESATITKNRAGNPYPLAEGNARYLLNVKTAEGNPVNFGWLDANPKNDVAGFCAPSYRSSHGYAAVHGDLFIANPKQFHDFVNGKKDDSPVKIETPNPAVIQTPQVIADTETPTVSE